MIRILVIGTSLIMMSCTTTTIYPLGSFNINETRYYMKDIDNYHDLIVGTWRWKDGDSSFEITLQEFEMFNYPSSSTEFHNEIFGRYTYINDEVLIADVQNIETIPNSKVVFNFDNETRYKVIIKDIVSGRTKVGEFVLTSSSTAIFRLWNSEGLKINEGNGQDFVLPTNLVLTKQ